MNKLHPVFEAALAPFTKHIDHTVHFGSTRGPLCSAKSGSLTLSTSIKLVDCEDCLDLQKRMDPDYDPTPWCIHCGTKAACKCPPHPEND